MVQVRRESLCLLMVCLMLGLASAQLDCPLFTIDILGSTTNLSTGGLLASSFTRAAETTTMVPVKVIDYRILCDASGRRRDTSSYVSLLVQFQCLFNGGTGNLAECDGTTNITRQYQYRCSDSNVWVNTVVVETLDPTATFQTEVTNQCRQCGDQTEFPGSDPDTHCVGCQNPACNQGQGRCYIENFAQQCCNFYLVDNCTAECPAPLVPNSNTFDCECPPLTLGNGTVSFTSGNTNAIGSIVTYTCNHGYDLVGDVTRTCTIGGWSGAPGSCNLTKCAFLPAISNGQVMIDPSERTLNAQATYICDSGYSLIGNMMRVCQARGIWSGEEPKCELCKPTDIDPDCIECAFDESGNQVCRKCKGDIMPLADGKCPVQGGNTSPSTCDTGCVVGIVLAILGAIIMAVVVALVVYAVYSYLTNPATKLAKAGTEGLNGVARDNPLYLPPDEIVGDVETA